MSLSDPDRSGHERWRFDQPGEAPSGLRGGPGPAELDRGAPGWREKEGKAEAERGPLARKRGERGRRSLHNASLCKPERASRRGEARVSSDNELIIRKAATQAE